MTRPIILVTTDRRALGPTPVVPAGSPRLRPPRPELVLKQVVVDVLRAAGGLPLLVPPVALADDDLQALLRRVKGVVITGGAFDIHPRHYGQAVHARVDEVDDARTDLELALARACLETALPVLGVCGGLQALAVAGGGSLVQDIGTQVQGALEHEQPTDPAEPWHPLAFSGPLRGLQLPPEANSTHHQAVEAPGVLLPCAHAPDGVIEALCSPQLRAPSVPFVLGVQWHPELLDAAGQWPYRWLVKAAGAQRQGAG